MTTIKIAGIALVQHTGYYYILYNTVLVIKNGWGQVPMV